MPAILNIETATEICSVAVAAGGEVILKEDQRPNIHSASLTIFIEEILEKAGLQPSSLDAVAVSIGPGSYTGLRIGLSVAKGLCYALDKPLIAVPTLQAMAAGAALQDGWPEDVLFCPMIDARRMEVYSAFYRADGSEYREARADIVEEGAYSDILGHFPVVFSGNGMEKCRQFLQHRNAKFAGLLPSARFMTALSDEMYEQRKFADLAYTEPFYLKEFYTPPPRRAAE